MTFILPLSVVAWPSGVKHSPHHLCIVLNFSKGKKTFTDSALTHKFCKRVFGSKS